MAPVVSSTRIITRAVLTIPLAKFPSISSDSWYFSGMRDASTRVEVSSNHRQAFLPAAKLPVVTLTQYPGRKIANRLPNDLSTPFGIYVAA
jgi:hypothetical protein